MAAACGLPAHWHQLQICIENSSRQAAGKQVCRAAPSSHLLQGVDAAEVDAQVQELLRRVGLPAEMALRPAQTYSGGCASDMRSLPKWTRMLEPPIHVRMDSARSCCACGRLCACDRGSRVTCIA